jgi:ParB-like chromosome segregation protein Spo0J
VPSSRRFSADDHRAAPPVVELVDEITLGGTRVRIQGQDLDLSKVRLDPANPRVANTVLVSAFGEGEVLQASLVKLLWDDPDVHALYQSILQNKGLIERIIVRHDGVVAEGNCRTVVYKKLAENYPNEPAWRRIPARVLPADITERQVAILLGELHVGGKNQWSPFEKAGHIYKLFNQFGLTQDEIAKLLKTSKTAVNHNNRAFAAMKEKYLPTFPGTGAVRKFSYFLELYKQPQLREWVSSNESALDDFVQWVGLNKIARGADVRELTEIVGNEGALRAFRTQGYEAARKVLELDRPELTSPLFKLMVDMTEALDAARLDEIQKVRKDKVGSAKTIVRNLKNSLDRFVDLCDGI